MKKIIQFIKNETVLSIAWLMAVLTMFLVPPSAAYLDYIDFHTLALLFALMAVMAGLQGLGLFRSLGEAMLNRTRTTRQLEAVLLFLPFLSSMIVTNDVALIVFVPFTLMLMEQLGCSRQIVPIIVLQTVAANLGSMATPVGNPQNLYLYAAFSMNPADFFSVVLPLTAVSLVALTAAAYPVLPKQLQEQQLEDANIADARKLLIYAGLFVLCLLTVFRVVPYPEIGRAHV